MINPKRGLDHLDVVEMVEEARQAFMQRQIPAFDDLNQALQAIAKVNQYYKRKNA